MGKGRRRREPFRQQQNFIRRFAFGEFLNRAPFVKQARRGADDIFTNRFQQKMNGFGHAGKFRADGHHERARLLNNAMRTPVRVRLAMEHRRLWIEVAAHRLDVFLPRVVVQNEIAQTWMTFKVQAEQILGFALVPVRSVNKFDDTRKSLFGKRRIDQHMNPASVLPRRKTHSATAIHSRLPRRPSPQN